MLNECLTLRVAVVIVEHGPFPFSGCFTAAGAGNMQRTWGSTTGTPLAGNCQITALGWVGSPYRVYGLLLPVKASCSKQPSDAGTLASQMVAKEYEGVGELVSLAEVIEKANKRKMFEVCEGNVSEEVEDSLLLGRRGSRLAICITSPTHLTQLFDRLDRVQLDDDAGQDFFPSKSMDFPSRSSMDCSPNFPSRTSMDLSATKSMDFSTSKLTDFPASKYIDFSPSKSILKSSRGRSRRKSVKFHFADEQTTVWPLTGNKKIDFFKYYLPTYQVHLL